ncbi:hypothetical protein MMMDOFMJ_2774 [Methylobacterium gnaphalii]|nr:hypothetical protein MMMDOFMJ_2774 [Methylobacterium gnaphalii]
MGHAHAPADGDVPTRELVLLVEDGDEAKVVREDVDLVGRRHRDDDLELTRQVGLAVDRLELLLSADDLLAVEPDLAPGIGLWQKGVGDGLAELVGRLVGANLRRIGRGHDVAVHVAASGDGVEQSRVDGGHGPLEVRLDDAVILEGLARRGPQRAVSVGGGEIIEDQPLPRRHHAAGDTQADHEAVGLLQLLLGALGPQVAIVLHVHAVELDELSVILGDGARGVLQQALGEAAAQVAAGDLEMLVMGEAGLLGRYRIVDRAPGRRRLIATRADPGALEGRAVYGLDRLVVVHGDLCRSHIDRLPPPDHLRPRWPREATSSTSSSGFASGAAKLVPSRGTAWDRWDACPERSVLQ